MSSAASILSVRRRAFVKDASALVVEVWLITLVGIILLHVAVVIIVHPLRLLFAMSSSLDLVILVQALCLGELVDLTSDEAGKEFFRESMINGLACQTVSR
jgi:hypothetical protein